MEYPPEPGVYLMKDEKGKVLYVGKAKSLKKRIDAYYSSPKKMMEKVEKIDFIVCKNEIEALILENNLIKKYNPKYNIRLKDDKRYPYIAITEEKFPRITLTRKIGDGKYFGPYGDVGAARKTLKILRKIFPFRTCKKFPKKECLYYHINLCPAPCINKISEIEYLGNIAGIEMFLKGRYKKLLENLKKRMDDYSKNLDFERAREVRDKIHAIQRFSLEQDVFLLKEDEFDVVGIYENEKVCIQVFFFRSGKIVGNREFVFEKGEEILESFVKQYYLKNYIPKEIVISRMLKDKAILKLLEERKGEKLRIKVLKRGKKYRLLRMAEKNAETFLKYQRLREREKVLERMKKVLDLPLTPVRIEAFDVSNLFGESATASSVYFVRGKKRKEYYRHYKIQKKGIDDYAMMKEVVSRRYKNKKNIPDLILMDGGRGQLNVAKKVLDEIGLEIPVVAIAKKREEIYTLSRKKPILLPKNSEILKLIQKIRDEAHRFAISYHKKLQKKKIKKSLLDEIYGIGEKRKLALLKEFGSVEGIKRARIEEINAVVKDRKLAERIKLFLIRDKP